MKDSLVNRWARELKMFVNTDVGRRKRTEGREELRKGDEESP